MNWETDWLASRSRLTPDREAIVNIDTGERWTYRALQERAERMAGFLLEQGVGLGDRIVILAPNHSSHFELLFACSKIGAISVPLNYRLAEAEIVYILKDCQPRLILSHSSLSVLTEALRGKIEIPIHAVDSAFLPIDMKWEINPAEVGFHDPLMIIYTGGTTGKPKGVVLSHQNVFWNSLNTIISWGLSPQDVTVTYLPLFHTGGINALSLPILHMGGKVILGQKFTPEEAIETIEKERCTIILMVPTMYHQMLTSPLFQTAEFASVHTFLSGGAPCPHSIYEAFARRGLWFKEGYGLTEAGPNNFYISLEDAKRKRGSVGKPMLHSIVKIVDEDGHEAAPGTVGELYIQGHHVFEYYYNNMQETAAAKQDGWLKTGDLAMRDEQGYYFIVGRKKDMIITGGENVYPQEIEHVLDQHPLIDEAIVVGLPDEKWGEAVTAAIVLKPGKALPEPDLRDYIASKIGKYKVPKKFFFVEKLAKTPIGKIDRKAMIAILAAMQETGRG